MRVVSFQMAESVFVPGVGMIKDSVTDKFYPGFVAILDKSGMFIKCKYKNSTFLIPVIRCEVVVVENDV